MPYEEDGNGVKRYRAPTTAELEVRIEELESQIKYMRQFHDSLLDFIKDRLEKEPSDG